MRNSSLVEGSGAENVTGLKSAAEAVDVQVLKTMVRPAPACSGGRVLVGPESLERHLGVVGERSSGDEGESRGLLERGEVRIPE